MSTQSKPLLSVRDLKVDISTISGTLSPVRSVDLDVGSGETVAIVGESGCGKSLTAFAIMGLLPGNARRGASRLELCGEDIFGASKRRLRQLRGDRIAMIFQDPMTALDPCYRVGDQMCEVLRQHRPMSRSAAMARSLELLTLVGIPAAETRLKQFPHQLSGGLRQRVMIAMALLCEPDIIIADEPTTALDVTVQVQILTLLRELQAKTGFGLILITHDLGVVAGVADRIVVMYGGEVVEVGETDTVLSKPLHPYTEGLLQAVPQTDEAPHGEPLGTIPGVVPPQTGERVSCGFLERCPYHMEACAEAAVPMVQMGDDPHEFRCLLPADAVARDPHVWRQRTGVAA